MRYGRPFRWFAWYPVWTNDRGWRWLRIVWRRRWWGRDVFGGFSGWDHRCTR